MPVPVRRRRSSTDLVKIERTIFKAQLGLGTRAQLLSQGATDGQIRSALAQGRWLRSAPGLYALANWPSGPARLILAARLMTGGVASHASAAWLWGLPGRGCGTGVVQADYGASAPVGRFSFAVVVRAPAGELVRLGSAPSWAHPGGRRCR
jgi:hypothetical protein